MKTILIIGLLAIVSLTTYGQLTPEQMRQLQMTKQVLDSKQAKYDAQIKSECLMIKEQWLNMAIYPKVYDGRRKAYVVNSTNTDWAAGTAVVSKGKVEKFINEKNKVRAIYSGTQINNCRGTGIFYFESGNRVLYTFYFIE